MKNFTRMKVLVLSLMMLAGMFMPTSAVAQSDDFFRSDDDFNGNRLDGVTWVAVTQNFGEAPLGTGLLIMLGAGAGYAFLKKKEEKI